MRDGLQSIPQIMSTDDKKRWIDAAYAAGVRYLEAASFVPARLLPQMADAEQVIAHAMTYPQLTVTALVPNLKGAEKAIAAGVHRIVAPISVSAAHSLANVRKTTLEMVEEFARIRALIDSADHQPRLIAGLSTVFGCTLQGRVPLHFGNGFVLGQQAGETTHTLLYNEMPQHSHPMAATAATAGSAIPAPAVYLAQGQSQGSGTPGVSIYSTSGQSRSFAAAAINNTGGSQPHPNQQPYLVLNFCISLHGIFPSRS